MRSSITFKIILLTLLISAISMVVLTASSLYYLQKLEVTAVEKVDNMSADAVLQSRESLDGLGKQYIKKIALQTRTLVELYLASHPGMTAEDLVKDAEFQTIGIQKVGEKGYTTVVMAKSQILVAHPNAKLMGIPILEGLLKRPEMQEWWKIAEPTRESVDNEGFYHWPESDGTFSDKYMYIAAIKRPTADGVLLNVASTTYLSEFNLPAVTMADGFATARGQIVGDLVSVRQNVQFTTAGLFVVLSIFVIVLSTVFSRRITRPIIRLTEHGRLFAKGDLTVPISAPAINDEVGVLAVTMEAMRKELGASRANLEKLVRDRTKELEQAHHYTERLNAELTAKVRDLERINGLLEGRETLLVEMKAEIARLKKKS